MAPQPSTATRAPAGRPAILQACTALAAGSTMAAASKSSPPGTGRSAETGTATRSAKPPGRWTPMSCRCAAYVPQPALAQVTFAAGQDRIDDYRVAVVADPGELVAHDQGRHPEARMADPVQLAAADAGRAHVDQDIAVGHDRLGHVLHLDGAWPGEDERLHAATPASTPVIRGISTTTSVSAG